MPQTRKIGITPLALALVHDTLDHVVDESRDVYQADRPAYYAEAVLGVAPLRTIKKELAKLVEDINSGTYEGELPYFKKWLEEKGTLEVSDLEEVLWKSEKKSAALVRQEAVQEGGLSPQGSLKLKVKSRKTGVDSETLSLWDVDFSNFAIVDERVDPNYRRTSQSPSGTSLTNRKRLWMDKEGSEDKQFLEQMVKDDLTTWKEIGKELHLADYAEAAALTRMWLENNDLVSQKIIEGIEDKRIEMPFNFVDKWDLVFEAFARRYRFKQNYYDIDEFLFEHDIITPFYKGLMEKGVIHKEVIKFKRHFEKRGQDILRAMHRKLYRSGYKFSGFSREFVNVENIHKKYKTIGLVYENPNTGDSIRIVYDNTFYLPFVISKDFGTIRDIRGRAPYRNNPVRLLVQGKPWSEVDDRTDQKAEYRIHKPSKDILRQVHGSQAAYDRYLRHIPSR